MTERLVAGWDGTAAAERALEWALRHNRDCRSVTVVQVDDSSRSARPGAALDPDEAVARLHHARPELEVAVERQHGAAEDLLTERAVPDGLLVLGAQDPGDRLYGHRSSLAYRVAAAAAGRVAVVPLSHDHGRGVVVGVVRPGESPAAVLAAADEAAARRQRLVGVHAWRRLLDIDVFDLDPKHRAEAAERHDAQLDAMLAPAARAHPGLEIARKVVHGRAEDVLRAQSVGAALLVLGRDEDVAHRRRGTMQTVLLTSLVPVLVVPPTAATAGEG